MLDSDFPSLTSEFDEFFASPISFDMLEMPELDLMDDTNPIPADGAADTGNISRDFQTQSATQSESDTIYFFGGAPSSPSKNPADTAPRKLIDDHKRSNGSLRLVSPRRCLSQALELLDKMSFDVDHSSPCIMANANQDLGEDHRPLYTSTQETIKRNEQAIEDMERILKCSCSADNFLLTVIALTLFKVLDCYSAAVYMPASKAGISMINALPSPCSSRRESLIMNEEVEAAGIDAIHQSAQLVLVELHRVQRLLGQLLLKIKECGQETRRESVISSNTDVIDTSTNRDSSCPRSFPFSMSILQNLEPEIHQRVRAISSSVIEILKQD
jgi:hypothetical protein